MLTIPNCHLIWTTEWCHSVKHVDVRSKVMCSTWVHVPICIRNHVMRSSRISHCRVRKLWRIRELGICGENSIERFRKRLGWIVQICVMEANKSSVSKFTTNLALRLLILDWKMWFPLRLRLSWLWFAQNSGLILTSGWLKRWKRVSRLNVNMIECRLRNWFIRFLV